MLPETDSHRAELISRCQEFDVVCSGLLGEDKHFSREIYTEGEPNQVRRDETEYQLHEIKHYVNITLLIFLPHYTI